jgi:membrane dipeptidase
VLFDLHEDLSSYILNSREEIDLEKDLDRHADIPKYRRAGVRAFVGAVFPARYLIGENLSRRASFKQSLEEALNHILVYYRLARKYPVFRIVEDSSTLKSLFGEGSEHIGIVLGLEGAYPVREPDELEIYYRLGVRVLGLTWNVDNQYAASCMTRRDYGLTSMGVELVEKALDLGMVVDLAHASRKTMLDVLSIVDRPVMISHAGLRRFNDSPRNVDDEVLDMLRRNHGVIGVFFVNDYLAGDETSVDTIVEYIMYLRDNYGVEVIAIGSDYFGTTKLPRGLENIGLLKNLVDKLLEKGFQREDIDKILYGNALRVFMENIK